jgi:hypothetical protein
MTAHWGLGKFFSSFGIAILEILKVVLIVRILFWVSNRINLVFQRLKEGEAIESQLSLLVL